MQPDLTSKQQRLLRYLERESRRSAATPSLRQTAEALGVSHTAVAQMLKTLEDKGLVRREGRYSRTIHLLNRAGAVAGPLHWQEVPVVGRIAAGFPLYAQPDWEGSLVIDAERYRGTGLFALRVRGDSMKDAAIIDGDLVICTPRQYAENGEIVVVLIEQEEATVKRFFRRRDHIELQPENPAYPSMRYGFDQVLIQGKVIGVHRGPEGIR